MEQEELARLRLEVEELRKQNTRLEAAIDASPAGIVIADSQGKIQANRAAERILGPLGPTMMGQEGFHAYYPDGSDYPLAELPLSRALLKGETVAGELVLLKRHGEYRWTAGHAAPIHDEEGNRTAAVVVISDVTEAKRVEREAERFRLIAECSPDFVGMATPDGKTLYVNPGGLALCGYPPDADLRGKPIKSYHPDEAARRVLEEGVPTVMRTGIWQGESALIAKDGEEIPVSQVLMAHRDDQGEVAYLSTVMRDLRELRRLEAQLLHSQKLEAIGRLAGGIAHDFNNMLFVINNYVSMSIEALPEAHPCRRDLTLVLEAAERATTLCTQLLGFARKQIVSPEVVCLNDLLRNFERFIRRIIGESIELTTKLEAGLWNVRIDPAQFDRIVTNLTVNARDAQPGGGKLTLETRNALLDETYVASHPEVKPGKYVMLAVSDQGRGMTREVLERLFEPFFSTKALGEGTGLGLATVHGAVKQNGGHIYVYSEVGRGTTFKVYLPCVDEEVRHEPPSAPVSVRATETALVVEDEDLVRELTVRVLETAGFRVLESASPDEALEIARAYDGPIHLLVSDVVMPKMSGPQLAARILESRRSMRVLFVSGYTDSTIIDHGILAEGVEFLAKPFGRDQLLTRVREVLDGRVHSDHRLR